MSERKALRIVVYKEEDQYIAQCVDYDICTQAADMESLRDRMDCLVELEITESEKSGQELDPAPERFHKMWENQTPASINSHDYKLVAA